MIGVDNVLKGFDADRTKRSVVVSAHMIAAVVNGLRPMAWVDAKWVSDVEGVRVHRVSCQHMKFYSVYNTKALSESDHASLIERYCATRKLPDPAVEKKVGKALGYICPQPSKVDGSLKRAYFHRGEYYPESFQQSLQVDATTLAKVMREKKLYQKVFGKVKFLVTMD